MADSSTSSIYVNNVSRPSDGKFVSNDNKRIGDRNTDVVLVYADGTKSYAHTKILNQHSPLIREIDERTGRHKEVVVDVTSQAKHAIVNILHYAYFGKMEVNDSLLYDHIKAAFFLKMHVLHSELIDSLLPYACHPDTRIRALNIASDHKCGLKELQIDWVVRHFVDTKELPTHDQIKEMTAPSMQMLYSVELQPADTVLVTNIAIAWMRMRRNIGSIMRIMNAMTFPSVRSAHERDMKKHIQKYVDTGNPDADVRVVMSRNSKFDIELIRSDERDPRFKACLPSQLAFERAAVELDAPIKVSGGPIPHGLTDYEMVCKRAVKEKTPPLPFKKTLKNVFRDSGRVYQEHAPSSGGSNLFRVWVVPQVPRSPIERPRGGAHAVDSAFDGIHNHYTRSELESIAELDDPFEESESEESSVHDRAFQKTPSPPPRELNKPAAYRLRRHVGRSRLRDSPRPDDACSSRRVHYEKRPTTPTRVKPATPRPLYASTSSRNHKRSDSRSRVPAAYQDSDCESHKSPSSSQRERKPRKATPRCPVVNESQKSQKKSPRGRSKSRGRSATRSRSLSRSPKPSTSGHLRRDQFTPSEIEELNALRSEDYFPRRRAASPSRASPSRLSGSEADFKVMPAAYPDNFRHANGGAYGAQSDYCM